MKKTLAAKPGLRFDQQNKEHYQTIDFPLPPTVHSDLSRDPKHLGFTCSRYKFVGKMLGDRKEKSVVDVGCRDGFGVLLLSQHAGQVAGIDINPQFIDWADQNLKIEGANFFCHDILSPDPLSEFKSGCFDAAVSLDVIEHIESSKEKVFLDGMCNLIHSKGMIVVGTPNITANEYASPGSQMDHINLYSQERLRALLLTRFDHVFSFGMNDEVLHTGFSPMSHYLFAIGCGLKEDCRGIS